MISDSQAAAYGLLVQYAQDVFAAAPTDLAPAADPRLSPDWTLIGHLIARDAVFRKGPTVFGFTVCYGYVARSKTDPTQLVAVIRGTASLIEWLEDALFVPMPHPVAGLVESGFYGVYASMRYVPLRKASQDVVAGIAEAVGAGHLTVVGHSLGAALATYLTFSLAGVMGDHVQGCFLASPQPGDETFAKAFDARVAYYRLINRIVDAVPHVPFGPDYCALPRVTWVWPKMEQARICFGVPCQHHVLVYSSVLNYALSDWAHVAPLDKDLAACIKGPAITLKTA